MILKKLTKTLIVAATMIAGQSYAAYHLGLEALIQECATKLGEGFLEDLQAIRRSCSNTETTNGKLNTLHTVTVQEKLITVVSEYHYNKNLYSAYVFKGNKNDLLAKIHNNTDEPPAKLVHNYIKYIKKVSNNPKLNPLNIQPAFKQGKTMTFELNPKMFLSKLRIITARNSAHRDKLIMLKIFAEIYKHAPTLYKIHSYNTDELATIMSICIVEIKHAIDKQCVKIDSTLKAGETLEYYFLSSNSDLFKQHFKSVMESIKPIKGIVKHHLEKRIEEAQRQEETLKKETFSNLIIKTFN